MIGGFKNKVSDIDFKYTIDPSRIFWVKTFYPYLGRLVSAIQNIDYNSYDYEGICIFTATLVNVDTETELFNDHSARIDVVSPLDYCFFGGICYELLNDSSKNKPPLSNYVDPTGDIDIIITIKPPKPSQDAINAWLKHDPTVNGYKTSLLYTNAVGIQEVNPYYLDIAQWTHYKFVEVVRNLQLNIPNSVEFDISEYSIINQLEFIDERVGNSHVILYVEGDDTIKIQLIFKIVLDGLAVIDHVAEFLVSTGLSVHKENKLTINGTVAKIQDILTLFVDNFEAHQKRSLLVKRRDITKYHKPINHTCRILYLFEYIKQNRIPMDWQTFDSIVLDPFRDHIAYNNYDNGLIYYTIIKGVFNLSTITLDDLINAYFDIFNYTPRSSFDIYLHSDQKYNMIQQLVLHNVREKSIPQSLKTSIIRRRVDAGIKRKSFKKSLKKNKRKKYTKRN